MKACPYCTQEIEEEAVKCKHCGGWLVDEAESRQKKIDQDKAVRNLLSDEKKPEMKAYGEDTIYFSIPNKKLVVMSILTLSFYDLYWFYKNWQAVKMQEKKKVSPFWRAFFCIIFCYSLFKRVLVTAQEKGYRVHTGPEVLAVVYIAVSIISNRIEMLWWLGLLSFIPLLIAANAIRYSNQKINPEAAEHTRLNGPEIVFLVIGLIFWLLIGLGAVLPEEDPGGGFDTRFTVEETYEQTQQ